MKSHKMSFIGKLLPTHKKPPSDYDGMGEQLDAKLVEIEGNLISFLDAIKKSEQADSPLDAASLSVKAFFRNEIFSLSEEIESMITLYSVHLSEEKNSNYSSFCDVLLLGAVDDILKKLKIMHKSIQDLLPLDEKTDLSQLYLYQHIILENYHKLLGLTKAKLRGNLQIALAMHLEGFISELILWCPQVEKSIDTQSTQKMNKKLLPLIKSSRAQSDKENDNKNTKRSSVVFFHLPTRSEEVKSTSPKLRSVRGAIDKIEQLIAMAIKARSKIKESSADVVSHFYESLHSLDIDKLSNELYLYNFFRKMHLQRQNFQLTYKCASPSSKSASPSRKLQ